MTDWSVCPKVATISRIVLRPNPHCRAKRPIQDWVHWVHWIDRDSRLGAHEPWALCAKAPLPNPRPPRLISISETPRHREASIHKTSPPPFQNLLRLYYDRRPLSLCLSLLHDIFSAAKKIGLLLFARASLMVLGCPELSHLAARSEKQQ
jgi:hypothetical protein